MRCTSGTDGFVKRASAARRFISRHPGVLTSMPYCERFSQVAAGAFSCAVFLGEFLLGHQGLTMKMKSVPKDTSVDLKETKGRKKGWWARFLERLARANAESPAVVCRH